MQKLAYQKLHETRLTTSFNSLAKDPQKKIHPSLISGESLSQLIHSIIYYFSIILKSLQGCKLSKIISSSGAICPTTLIRPLLSKSCNAIWVSALY